MAKIAMTTLRLHATVVSLFIFSYLAGAQIPHAGGIAQLSNGDVSGNNYHNPELGFRYQFPAGWTANLKEVQFEHKFGWKDNPTKNFDHGSTGRCSKDLLFITQHPEEMRVVGFNPMAVLIAVDPDCLPGVTLPISTNDREAIQRLAKEVLNHLDTPPTNATTTPRLHPFEIDGRVMLEISQQLSVTVREPGKTRYENIPTSLFTMKIGGYWIILIMASGNDVDLNTLRASKIFFDPGQPGTKVAQ